MKYLLALVVSISSPALAFDITPGLWEIKTEITHDGKKFNPQEEMKKALGKMTPEQKEALQGLIAGAGIQTSLKDMTESVRTCYSKEDLSDATKVLESSDCKMNLRTQTATTLSGTFECKEDQSSGTFHWTVKSKSSYTGVMTGTTKDGKTSMITQSGKYISADCGTKK